jgi:hypothetical protein
MPEPEKKCTRPPQSPPCTEPTLQERAEAALTTINRYPAVLGVTPERRARWLSAVVKMAGAAADFAVLAAEGTEDAFMEAGAIGDALLASRAAEAAGIVVEAQEQIGTSGYFSVREEWGDFGASLASGDSDGERGQRLLIAIAEKLEARFGF